MSLSRFVSVRALIAASLAGVCLGAMAQSQADAPAAHQQLDGMRVVIDPVTKQLRAPTAAEAKAFEDAQLSSAKVGSSKPTPVASRFVGAKGMKLGAEHMSYSRAAIGADGKLNLDCVEGTAGLATPVAGQVQRMEAELE
jgi:hypothetical protein